MSIEELKNPSTTQDIIRKINELAKDTSNYQTTSNLVTTISDESTDTEYPSAKLLYDKLAEKQGNITGAATTVVVNNLTANKALVSDSNGKISVSDITSTELGYLNDVTSNVQTQFNNITDLIPAAASTSNELADKEFVNSSIASNTANFIGTFNSVAELEAYSGTVTNNDYAFVINGVVTDNGSDWATFAALDAYNKALLTHFDYAWVINGTKFDLYRFDIVNQQWDLRATAVDKDSVALNTAYNRYKATVTSNVVSWDYEYTLNNSSFSSAQWAAINSGITENDVALIGTALQPNDNVSSLTNDAGYISGINSSDVTTALGYTPQNSSTAVTHTTSTAVGNTNTPVYVASNGVATALSFTIAKSVPSDAKFTDTTYAFDTGSANGTISVAVDGGTATDIAVKGLGSAAYTDSTAYATAAQGTKADSAVQSITTGSANGTIAVDGTDVSVYGLGSAAYTASTAYATSSQGSKADSAIQSVKVNGAALTPDANKAVDVTVPTNYVTTDTDQNVTGTKTFVGQKKILFKQSSGSDKLGFTLYNSSNSELGAFEYRPSTINGGALLNINVPYTSSDYVGFRYWGTAVNIIAPKVATAGDYYIPVNITDGNTTVTANNVGTINISSLLPTIPTVNNATLTIQKNGTTVKTFTANASSDVTANITVPTKLSDITVSAGSNISISGDTISATDTTYSDFTGCDSITAGTSGLVPAPSANDQDKYLKADGTWSAIAGVIVDQTYDPTSANAQSGVAIAGAGFITGINSSDVTTALGYTPYDSSNPNGYTSNVGTVTKVNNTSPDSSGNVSLTIPTTTDSVTSGSSAALTSGGAYTNVVRRLSSSAATGSASQGVYVDASGQVQACDAVTSTYSSTGTAPVNGTAVKSAIDSAISSVYKPAGSIAFANRPTLSVSVLGNVYNITDDFTTTADFVEGAGKKYSAGTNIVVINTGTTQSPVYKFDVLGNFVDLSGYQLAETAVTHTKNTAAGNSTTPVYINSSGVATALSYTIAKSVPSDAVFTDTTYSVFTGANGTTAGTAGLVKAPAATDNTKYLKGDGTWSTVDALPSQTGNSGKYLTTNGSAASWVSLSIPTAISDLIDDTATTPIDKADYATSAGTASSATTASTLGSADVGSATQGIYLDDGTPKACTYTVSKSVPSDAVFTDTDTKVTQNVSSTNSTYPILLCPTANASTNQGATTSIFASGVKVNPSTKTITATTFDGNATTATTASKLGSTTVGGATTPIYLNAGTPTALSYTIAKSVPADAKFTDTTYSDFVGSGSTAAAGLVPKPPTTAGTSKYLREDGSWQIPPDNNTTYANGTGITIGTGNAINHSNSVTAATAGTSSATSGSTLAVPYVTYDAQGHVTASGTHTHTVTGFATSDTQNTCGAGNSTSKLYLVGRTAQSTGTSNSNSSVYTQSGYLYATTPASTTNDTTVATTKFVKDQGYTSNTGTVTSVNNVSPVNGNVTLSIPTVDQTYNSTSANAQSGVAIAGAGFLQVKGAITSSTTLTTLEEGIYTVDGVTHSGFPDTSQAFYGVLIQYGGTYKPQLLVAGMPSVGGLYHRRYLTGSSSFTGWVRCGNSATGSNSFSMGGTPVASSGGTVVGIEATTSANYGTSFGYKAKCTASSTVAIGRVSTASGAFSVAIGYGATVSSAGGKSIQLGYGTNSTATSFSVGFQDVGNYQLLDGTTGYIPNARINMDSTPTASSTNTVTSGGVYTALSDKISKSEVYFTSSSGTLSFGV